MEEVIELAASLDDRAVLAKQSTDEAEKLIIEFKAFLNARVSRYSVRADAMQREEMLSTAMLAFYEAIRNYNAEKGHFLPFANMIICKRLIDYNRRAVNHSISAISLDEESEEQESAQSSIVSELSIRAYEAERKRESLVDEIEQFKEELDAWGLSLSSLVDQSPKQSRLRDEYKMVVSKIMQAPDILQTIQIKRYFPQKAIGEITGLPQKKLERARNFILASLIIKMGDYEILADYVTDGRYI